MVQFRWINTSLFAILPLLLTAVTGLNHTSVTVKVGDEATLPCDNVIKTQDECDRTSWIASRSGESAKQLVNLGRISKSGIPKSRSDRLSVTESCSLVIKNVSVVDVGRYSCRQFDKSGKQQGEDASVHLSVVNVEKLQGGDTDILTCSVLLYGECGHTVKWLYDDNMDGVKTKPLGCSATVTYKPPHLNQKSNYYKLPECEVTVDQSGQKLLWKVNSAHSSQDGAKGNDSTVFPGWWWVIIIAAVGFAALLIIAVAVIRWKKKAKGNKTQRDENTGQKLNPAVTQSSVETSQDMAEPEDGVSYASISYTKMTSSRPQACGKGENDEGDAVTYSTVKASCSSAEPSADPSSLYATVNKPNKKEAIV